jgi:tetratricopeptide (TPR) repeat protein
MGDRKLAAKEYEMAIQSFIFCLVDGFLTYPSIKGKMNDSLLAAFPWRRICTVSEDSDAAKIYDGAIFMYNAALDKGGSNELLCNYEYKVPHDIFQYCHLSKEYLWVALSETYYAKDEFVKSIEGYESALSVCLSSDQVWLHNRLGEMRRSLGERGSSV